MSRYEHLNFWSGLTHRIANEKGRGHARGGRGPRRGCFGRTLGLGRSTALGNIAAVAFGTDQQLGQGRMERAIQHLDAQRRVTERGGLAFAAEVGGFGLDAR